MKESGFYVIDVLPLKRAAGKPHHLEERLKSRRARCTGKGKSVAARREQILKERTNRLHDRDMHIQKVVRQHREKIDDDSTAKAQKIHDAMHAADRKRAMLLKSQQTSCAKTVAHAKQVAELHQKTFTEEIAAKRERIESKHKLVASRRQAFLSMPRSHLLNINNWSTEELEIMHTALDESAIAIQNWYTNRKLRPLCTAFRKTGVSFAGAKEMKFEDLVKVMQSKSVISAGSAIVNRVRMMSCEKLQWNNPSRVFLSAYMISTHPSETMPVVTEVEETLIKSGERMVAAFEEMLLNATKPRELALAFLNELRTYYTQFEEWKKADTKKISDSMIAHWLELEKLWLSVRHTQVDAETNWRPKISRQQKSIQQKLAQFGVGAIQQLKREQRKMRIEMGIVDEMSMSTVESDVGSSSAYESEDNASSTDILSTSPQRFPTGNFMKKRDSVNMSRTTSRSSSPLAPQVEGESPKVVPAKLEAAPASNISEHFGAYLSNERLARELVRNPDFELKPDANKSKLELQVSQMAKKAFFDAAREQFSKGIYINFVPSLLDDIKKQLLSMVSETGKLAEEIKEHLDIDLITHQIKHNVFDAQQCIGYIVSKLGQLCAPVRDQSVRNISKMTDIASMFEATLQVLEDMKMDLLNYRLKQLAPHLKEQAVEYERAKFKEALVAGKVALTQTEEWFTKAYASLEATKSARNPENIVNPHNRVSFEDVYNDALMKVLFSNTAVSVETLPETLLMDGEYLFSLQNEAQLLTIVAALVMLSKNAVAELRHDKSGVESLRDRLFVMLKDDGSSGAPPTTIENLAQEVIRIVNLTLSKSKSGSTISPETEQFIKSMVERTISTKDKVYSLLSRRVQGLVLGQLNTGNFRSVTGMSLTSAGLDVVEKELVAFSKKVYQLAVHNKEVHAEWYDDILKKIIV